jgi:putative SOS response-associated peptidase YedK
MYFKISNTAEMKEIEREVNALFKYPNFYTPQVVISGFDEVSIPIITMIDSRVISLAIWGLLPSSYNDDWELFQKLNNTLNINYASLKSELWYRDALSNGRCVIPVTGFFTSVLRNGEIYPYYISSKNEKMLYLAGIYTVLEDGFITCAILTGPLRGEMVDYQNLVDFMPIIIDQENKDTWLSNNTEPYQVKAIIKSPHSIELRIKPIEKNLFNQDISYDSMLMPDEYPED